MAQLEPEEEQGQWPNLTNDVLSLILERVHTQADLCRFRSICKSWRSFASPPQPHLLFPLSLPSLQSESRPLSLSPTSFYLFSPNKSTQNPNFWLAKVSEIGPNRWTLLNPLIKNKLGLPPGCPSNVVNFLGFRNPEVGRSYQLQLIDDEGSDGKDTFDFEGLSSLIDQPKVVVKTGEEEVYVLSFCRYDKIALLKFGDEQWRIMKNKFGDVICYDGKFFAVDRRGRLAVFDFTSFEFVEVVPALEGWESEYTYLVESNFRLYLVVKLVNPRPVRRYDEEEEEWVLDNSSVSKPLGFKVFVYDKVKMGWEKVESLGNKVFFVSRDAAFSVSAEDLGWSKGNCVYFEGLTGYDDEADMAFGLNAGVYTLGDNAVRILRSLDDPWARIFKPPSGWFGQGVEYPEYEMLG